MAERGTSDACLRSWRESAGVWARAQKRSRAAVAIFEPHANRVHSYLPPNLPAISCAATRAAGLSLYWSTSRDTATKTPASFWSSAQR